MKNFLILILASQCLAKKVDLKKEFEDHQTCNGEYVTLPPDWLADALLAGVSCVSHEDEHCFKTCVGHTYKGGSLVKKNIINEDFLKKETRKLDLSEKNQKAKDALIKAIVKCGADLPEDTDKPAPGENYCPNSIKFDKCLDDAWDVHCKGKKPSNDFLD